MTPEQELERRQDIATAKLGVAEELRWLVAIPFGGFLYLKYDSWLLAGAGFVICYFLVTYWYNKEYVAASDAYERATGTGKYYTGQTSFQRELQRIENERKALIDQAAREGKTISTERALKHVEELRSKYAAAGRFDDARATEELMKEVREKYGVEIPIDEAYRLQKEIERRTGES